MSLVLITNDLYDIDWRLRAINAVYRIFYNTETSRYEVHCDDSGKAELVLPFDELDCRAVDYVLQTRVQNAVKLFEQIERDNALLEKRQSELAVEKALRSAEDVVRKSC